jgi:DNA-binding PadR family transcriptional regulator
MPTAEVLLALLQDGPSHGYDVKRGHDHWFPDTRPLAYGQVYSTLGRLERDGLIEVIETKSEGAAERTVYALTELGAQRVSEWLAEPESSTDRGADELVRKTMAAFHSKGGATSFVSRQRAAHLRQMRELTEAPLPDDPLARLARDHTIAHLDADLRWLEAALDRTHHSQGDR